jgi:hypothetical protein
MTPNRHSRSETVKEALQWGFGVLAPMLLTLLIFVLWG